MYAQTTIQRSAEIAPENHNRKTISSEAWGAQSVATNAPAAVQVPGRGGFAPVVIGSSAPVPPEVAIPRPTPEELALVNMAVTKWIASDTSSAKPLLQKFELLLMLHPARLNVAATYTQTKQRMGPRHLGFVETASRGNIDLLLHGDSITDWWVLEDANKAIFEKYFGSVKTANFAIAGDTTQGVLWGLKNGEGQGFRPKAIMLMIGTNNSSTCTAPEIAEGIGAVVLEMQTTFPCEDSPAGDFPAEHARRSRARQNRRGQQDHFEA